MPSKSGFEGVYSSAESPKRRAQVLERLQSGHEVKRIAKDLGVDPGTVERIAERLRAEGQLPGGPAPIEPS
jgi:DNA-binding NarL/FixJ family response regulator